MKIRVKNLFLAASLAALAVSAVAQSVDSATSKTPAPAAAPKHATGKTTRRALPQSSAAKHKTSPAIKNVGQKNGAAHLQTGQLTTTQAANSKTTPEESAQPNAPSNKNTSVLRLKKHNARMF